MDFLKLNWVIIFIIIFFLGLFMSLERKYKFVSEKIGIHPFKLYMIIFVMGSVSAALNYIALRIFGSWQTLATTIVISLLFLLIIVTFIRRKIRRRKENKELERLRKEEQRRSEQEIQELAHEETERSIQADLEDETIVASENETALENDSETQN